MMHIFTTFLLFVLSATQILAQSSTPRAFKCASVYDKFGSPFCSSEYVTSTFKGYFSITNELNGCISLAGIPHDYCVYQTNGALKQDPDATFCPAAVSGTTSRLRARDAAPARPQVGMTAAQRLRRHVDVLRHMAPRKVVVSPAQ